VRRAAGLVLAAALGAAAVAAAEAPAVTRTFAAPLDRVWAATRAALEREGWGIDHADRPLGVIVTKSRRAAGDDEGLHARNLRVRLRLTLTPAGDGRTGVAIEREVFLRERILWMDRDEAVVLADPLVPGDPGIERRVLAAIEGAL
jgi:hypothetical protein